jgi:stage V sporulation protein G
MYKQHMPDFAQKAFRPLGGFIMNITDIRIRKIFNDTRLRALVSITIDNEIAIHDIKVIEGPERFFVAMPSRRAENGMFRDIVHPITAQARTAVEEQIMAAYREYLENMMPDDITPSQEEAFPV